MVVNNPYIAKDWPAKLYRKIDVYKDGSYLCSTNAYINLTEAIKGIAWAFKINLRETHLKAVYDA